MSSKVMPVITRKGQEDKGTGQSGGCVRVSGVGPQHTPATKIWFGKVSNEPGYRSYPHHHGEAETGGYVLKGKARIYFGDNWQEFLDMEEGDFIFVPPHWPHIEVNMSTTEELVWLTTRTPDNIVVNLPDVDDSILQGFRARLMKLLTYGPAGAEKPAIIAAVGTVRNLSGVITGFGCDVLFDLTYQIEKNS